MQPWMTQIIMDSSPYGSDDAFNMGPHGGKTDVLVNRQGLELKTYYWPSAASDPSTNDPILLFVHGHGAHLQFEVLAVDEPGQAPRYENSWVQAMNNKGITVCGIDLQGCGLSQGRDGLRFYVESFDDYVDDVIQYAEMIVNSHPTEKIFIAGISLGGCIALHCVLKRKDLFNGMVLLAPMLSLERVSRKGLNPYLRPIGRFLSWCTPTLALLATDKNTVHPEIQTLWDADPLVSHMNTRVRNADEYLRVTAQVMTQLNRVDWPFLVFHSEVDTMCDPDGSKLLYTTSTSKDKTLRLVNSMWHVLVKEPGNDTVCRDIIDWLLERS